MFPFLTFYSAIKAMSDRPISVFMETMSTGGLGVTDTSNMLYHSVSKYLAPWKMRLKIKFAILKNPLVILIAKS